MPDNELEGIWWEVATNAINEFHRLGLYCEFNDTLIIAAKVWNGSDVHAKSDRGCTALMAAAMGGHIACVVYLIKKHSYVHAKNEGGGTALMLAAMGGHTACVKYLVKNGSDLHAKSEGGNTALKLADDCGHTECAQLLRALINK